MALTAKRIINIIYDIFTAIISILDVITDILVTMDFFYRGRTEFFIASLVILGVAQIAYAIAFWFKFDSNFTTFGGAVAAFCCLLPFSPILSFAFYFTADDHSPLYQCLSSLYSCESCSFSFRNRSSHSHDDHGGDAELEALRMWMKEKLSKHMGFIIEAMVEAFPQSILQLSAIVYFGDTDNYLSIASILLSMLSVSSKSFILSVTVSYNWKSVFFNWLSALCDFFGVFFIASFAFYVPPQLQEDDTNPGTDPDTNPFELISRVWMGLLLVTVVPFGLIGSIGINLNVCWKAVTRSDLNSCIVLFVQLAWTVGLCITVMAMSIACHLWFAVAILSVGFTKRVPSKSAQPFYLALISWIGSAPPIRMVDRDDECMNMTVSRRQHRMIRLCTVNRVLLDRIQNGQDRIMRYDRYLHQYLIGESKRRAMHFLWNKHNSIGIYSYDTVTMQSLKQHSTKYKERNAGPNAAGKSKWNLVKTAWSRVVREVGDKLDRLLVEEHFAEIVIYGCTPLYIVGRIIHLGFALLMMLYLIFGHEIHIFTADVPMFQTAMFVTYLVLVMMWMVSLRLIWKEIDCIFSILPSCNTLYDAAGYRRRSPSNVQEHEAMKDVMRHYEGVIVGPIASKYCHKVFGEDIATIIMMYFGCGAALLEDSDPNENPKETDSLTA